MAKTYLGIELGSTRIKAVLIGGDFTPLASGWHEWENRFENGFWTYSLEDVLDGVQKAYAALASDYRGKTGTALARVGGMGVSAMMHGYLAFDKNGDLLVPFRTWRNTTTGRAASVLTEAFKFNIPHRWSVAHLYQAILDNEPHIKALDFLTTLAGYVHFKLTGEKVLGVGDASGMFPIQELSYDKECLAKFTSLTGMNLADKLPKILAAGESSGVLTKDGASFLDPSGQLEAGIPLCPPEGDAGTGMAATNSVAPRTGNVSAGTSVFAMLVMEKPLKKVHHEIDIVTTPSGLPAAMVHCNSCTSDVDAWVNLFGEAAELLGAKFDRNALYEKLYAKALEGEKDGGGLLNYNFFSGEPVVGLESGCPLFFRKPEKPLNIANFMRVQLYSAIAVLKIGMEILESEDVRVDCLLAHGGLFKVKGVAQKLLAAALDTPVSVMESAGEGGAWGIALLAAYAAEGKEIPLEEFLAAKVFAENSGTRVLPEQADMAGFASFIKRYKNGLAVARDAQKVEVRG